jgi:MFS family permease
MDRRDEKTTGNKGFLPIVFTYTLGAFNDNFFKQAISLIAIYSAREEMQGLAAIVFAVPWLLFAAQAGWLADQFAKRYIIRAAKGLELVAMLCGAAGIILSNWPLIMLMLFIMAMQSTIFSPAINGSIPELYPDNAVIKINGRIKMFVNIANISGIILAGILLNVKTPLCYDIPLGRCLVAMAVVLFALIGFAYSFRCQSLPASTGKIPFPCTGPASTVKELYRIAKKDRLLWLINVADAITWMLAVWQILTINQLGKTAFGFNEQQTSYLLLPELLGIGVGGLLAARLIKGKHWYTRLPLAMLLLAICMGAIPLSVLAPDCIEIYVIIVLLFSASLLGGILLIPMESFFQIRPAANRKGTVIAAANFMSFIGILLAGAVDILFNKLMPMAAASYPPQLRFLAISSLAFITAIWLYYKMRQQVYLRQDEIHYA